MDAWDTSVIMTSPSLSHDLLCLPITHTSPRWHILVEDSANDHIYHNEVSAEAFVLS